MVQLNRQRLATLCKEHKVGRLRIFGSAARGEERPDSDIDLLLHPSRGPLPSEWVGLFDWNGWASSLGIRNLPHFSADLWTSSRNQG